MSAHTLFSDDAQSVATKDRAATADLVLEVAVRDAVKLIRLGRPGKATYVMTRAGMSAERIIVEPTVGRGAVWISCAGATVHVCTASCAPDAFTCCWGTGRFPHTFTDGVCIWCHRVADLVSPPRVSGADSAAPTAGAPGPSQSVSEPGSAPELTRNALESDA